MRDSVNRGRARLLGQLAHNDQTAADMDEQRERFQRLAREDAAPRVVSAFNLFQTPADLANRAAEMLDRRGRLLEPSAGLGRLYRAIRERDTDSTIVLVDQSPECCAELYRINEADRLTELRQGDFLAMHLGLFDGIIMNPPFKMGRDVKHILHARTMLAPGGRLVAFCAAGPKQRAKLQPLADQWIDLPAGSFKESYTNVSAAIVVFEAD